MKYPKFLSALLAAVFFTAFTGCASTQKQSSTGEYIDDSVLTTKVKSAIFNDPALRVGEINVETFRGVVQLSGFVGSQEAADHAVEVARNVNGVKSVKNDMRVKQEQQEQQMQMQQPQMQMQQPQ
jgi:osmotically-inducible protein OsmY